jgi:hypothetical protein
MPSVRRAPLSSTTDINTAIDKTVEHLIINMAERACLLKATRLVSVLKQLILSVWWELVEGEGTRGENWLHAIIKRNK